MLLGNRSHQVDRTRSRHLAMMSNIDTARAIFVAYAEKDRAAAERLLAGDFRFCSPLDNALGREKYFEICWPNSSAIAAFDIKHLVEDGDRVLVTYQASTTGGKQFRNTEVLTIRNSRIPLVEVYFGWNLPHEVPSGQHRDPS